MYKRSKKKIKYAMGRQKSTDKVKLLEKDCKSFVNFEKLVSSHLSAEVHPASGFDLISCI